MRAPVVWQLCVGKKHRENKQTKGKKRLSWSFSHTFFCIASLLSSRSSQGTVGEYLELIFTEATIYAAKKLP